MIFTCEQNSAQYKERNRAPLFPGQVQRWLVVTKQAGENPTEEDVRNAIASWFNYTLPEFGLSRFGNAERGILTPNVERLNVIRVSRTPFNVPGGKLLRTAEQLDPPLRLTSEESDPAIWVELEFLYTGDAREMPWPWAATGFLACPENAVTELSEVYDSLSKVAAHPVGEPLPGDGRIPFPEPPDVTDIPQPTAPEGPFHETQQQLRTAAKVVIWGGAAVALYYVLRTAQDVRGRVSSL